MTSFSDLYDQHFDIVIRIAYRFTGDKETAEDLCQDTFVKYYEKYGHIEDGDKALFYLIKIVKNLSINHEKRKRVEVRVFSQYSSESETYHNETALTTLMKKEEISDIQKALLLVPYKYRLPLILKEYEQMNYTDISKVTKSTVSNVKVLIHRAKKIFKEKIKEI